MNRNCIKFIQIRTTLFLFSIFYSNVCFAKLQKYDIIKTNIKEIIDMITKSYK